jgi:copper chaperone CopZ
MANQHLLLHITGMTCGHCENFVKSVIAELPGTQQVTVSHAAGTAEVDFDPALLSAEAIVAAVNETHIYKAN